MKRQLPSGKWHGSLSVFDPRESLFFRRRNNGSVMDQAGSTIMVGGIDTQ
jgi:hypothetical protein